MARIFFAVGFPSDASALLRGLQSGLERSMPAGCLRLTEPEQAHFTLRFLGELSAGEREAAVRAGHAAAGEVRPFALGLGRLGAFPDERRAHTLWIGSARGTAELVDLADVLQRRLSEHGFAKPDRPFVPHLTLARVKRRASPGLLRALLDNSPVVAAFSRVDRFLLLESRPTNGQTRYVPLATFRLETPCTPFK